MRGLRARARTAGGERFLRTGFDRNPALGRTRKRRLWLGAGASSLGRALSSGRCRNDQHPFVRRYDRSGLFNLAHKPGATGFFRPASGKTLPDPAKRGTRDLSKPRRGRREASIADEPPAPPGRRPLPLNLEGPNGSRPRAQKRRGKAKARVRRSPDLLSLLTNFGNGAQERTRTFTTVKPPAPEAGASTNSATWARRVHKGHECVLSNSGAVCSGQSCRGLYRSPALN